MVNTVVMHISMLYGSRCLNKNEEVRMSFKTVRWYLKHSELVKKMIESVLCHLENRNRFCNKCTRMHCTSTILLIFLFFFFYSQVKLQEMTMEQGTCRFFS